MPENIFYLARRAAAALFTRRCVCCKRAFSGKLCICEGCTKTLVPAKRISSYGFEAYSAYAYCGAAREAMLRFKFSENGGICMDTLSDWLCEAFDRCLSERSFDFVVGVPAFNSIESKAELLAKDFARRRSLRFCGGCLIKIRKTEKQHRLSAEKRKTNLIGAFHASPKADDKRILLIDDIFTTGSTASECVSALLAAGAREVCVLTVLKSQ